MIMEKRISGSTGLLALIGSPVDHSGSPAMYNYSFQKLGLDYAYVAFDIKVDEVKDAIRDAKKGKDMSVCSLYVKCQHVNVKLLPQKWVMKLWMSGLGKYLEGRT